MNLKIKGRRFYEHPAVSYGVTFGAPVAIWTGVGYLAGKGLKLGAKYIDETLPVALRDFQGFDERVGNTIIEVPGTIGGAVGGEKGKEIGEDVGRGVIGIDKKVKDFWGNLIGIDDKQREENRETLGLKEPSYLKKESEQDLSTKATIEQPREFTYFQSQADNVAPYALMIGLGYGVLKGAWRSGRKYIKDKIFNRKVDLKLAERLSEMEVKDESQ